MMRAAAGLVFLTSCGLLGQPAAGPPAFDVASVKPAAAQSGPGFRVSISSDAGRISFSNVSLQDVLKRAYGVKDHQISGPDWLNSVRFDIVAKLPAGAPKDQIPLMLQTLLADRFKVELHLEIKTLPVYALVVAKGGPKLREAESDSNLRMFRGPKGLRMTGKVSLARFADALSNSMDRPVLDQSGLNGTYDIDLEWAPDETQMRPQFGPGPGGRPEAPAEGKLAPDSDRPSIFAALEEKLGLRLEAKKSPLEILVIDHAEKAPTEN